MNKDNTDRVKLALDFLTGDFSQRGSYINDSTYANTLEYAIKRAKESLEAIS